MRDLHLMRSLAAAAFLCLSAPLPAAVQLVPVLASGLSAPTFVGHAGDGTGRLFIVERAGVIRVLPPGASAPEVFLDIGGLVVAGSERGLLGLAFHPQYATNGRYFVYYTRAGDGAITIAEYGPPGIADGPDAPGTVLLTIPHPTNTNHNGGMLAFGPDGYLYVGVGDGGSSNDPLDNAQNVGTLLGKILRIDVDHPDAVGGTPYSSPADNPYVGTAGRDEIFSIGWRNPWRFSFDRATHQQWVADVGQNAREEVDTPIVSGGNYGWRIYEGTRCTGNDPLLCTAANYLLPVVEYSHTLGRCSITGGYVYRGTQGTLPGGTYVYGDYCTGEIFAWDGAAQSLLLDTALNISSFGEDEAGEIYVVGLGGTLSRLAAVPSAPVIVGAASRKLHGATAFDLPLSLVPGDPTTEPRQGAATTVVISFDKAVTGAIAIVTEGAATAGTPAFDGNDVIVGLTGVANAQYASVSLTGVTSADGGTGGAGAVRIGFLAGDVSRNRAVTLQDLLSVNAVLAQEVSAANYLRDVNASGTLSLSDLLVVNANLTSVLPGP